MLFRSTSLITTCVWSLDRIQCTVHDECQIYILKNKHLYVTCGPSLDWIFSTFIFCTQIIKYLCPVLTEEVKLFSYFCVLTNSQHSFITDYLSSFTHLSTQAHNEQRLTFSRYVTILQDLYVIFKPTLTKVLLSYFLLSVSLCVMIYHQFTYIREITW